MNNPVLFAVITALCIAAFIISCWRRFRLVAVGRPADRTDGFFGRIWYMLFYAFGQRKVVSRAFGWNHFVFFWCFLILGLANADFIVQGMTGFGLKQLLPGFMYSGLILVFDIVSVVTVAAICMAVGRRLFFPPRYIDAKTLDAFAILSLVFLLMMAFFATHGAELLLPGNTDESALRPVSYAVAALFQGLPEGGVELWATVFWWMHAAILLSFLNYLPYSKHMHILTAVPNCFLRSTEQVNTLPRELFENNKSFGVGAINAFTWKDLFDSYSCTECGRCQDVCPATNTGKPLNPRMVIHEIKINLLANGAAMLKKKAPRVPLIGAVDGHGTVSEDSIWSCTSCGACMEVCPVFIEQMPKILQMRRYLVEMQAKVPDELITFFENSEQRSNPWGIAPGERVKWYSSSKSSRLSRAWSTSFMSDARGRSTLATAR
jgi:heterodisulfide reductase subunit C